MSASRSWPSASSSAVDVVDEVEAGPAAGRPAADDQARLPPIVVQA